MLHINTSNASAIGIIVQGASSQTQNLTEWQGSSSTVLASIDAQGASKYANVTLTSSVGTMFNSTSSKKIEFSGGDVIITVG